MGFFGRQTLVTGSSLPIPNDLDNWGNYSYNLSTDVCGFVRVPYPPSPVRDLSLGPFRSSLTISPVPRQDPLCSEPGQEDRDGDLATHTPETIQ